MVIKVPSPSHTGEYERTKLLVLGSTYPSYSQKYIETTCTGGLLPDGRLIRVYPVPRRYLTTESSFRKFQWIEVMIQRDPSKDPRPESYRVDHNSIRPVGEPIPTTARGHRERREHLLASSHLFGSLEVVDDRWRLERTSLGIVRPSHVGTIRIEHKSDEERRAWEREGRERLAQVEMFEEPLKPLDFPDIDVYVKFGCNDERCTGHEMKILDWGLHELWRRIRCESNAEDLLRERVRRDLDVSRNEVFFFLGNLHNLQWTFCLMGHYSFPRRHMPVPQTQLFV